MFYRDRELKGFALRVTRQSISYVVEKRVNGTNRRITLGSHTLLTPEMARKEAERLLAMMAAGIDPQLLKQRKKITLRQVFDDYLQSRTLRRNTIKNYTALLKRCFADWLELPIAGITKDMVELRHRELTKTTRQGTSGKCQANDAMVRLSVLINFAMSKYEVAGQPIILRNPVKRLSEIRAWHHLPVRQNVIPKHKLAEWYQAAKSVRDPKIRDYLLLILFTGLRRTEASSLKWSDIDFGGKVLTVRAENSKNHCEHRLPLSDFLYLLLKVRKRAVGESEFVFPGRSSGHIIDSGHIINGVAVKCDHHFTIHDLRRTFLTTAEMLGVPHYALRKMANHRFSRGDLTGQYVVIGVERLRVEMKKISEHLIEVMGIEISDFF